MEAPKKPPVEPEAEAHGIRRGILFAFATTFVLVLGLVAVSVSAQQVLIPHKMPFGVTGSSPVVTAAESAEIVPGHRVSFVNTLYPNESAAMDAINQGKIYGAYITGKNSDTLLSSEAKSFFAYTEVVPLFASTAKKMNRPLTVQVVKPLPAGKDPNGAMPGLLMAPAVIGGVVAAILIFTLTQASVQRWRGLILLVSCVIGGLVIDLIEGPLLGAYAGNRFWPLLPCIMLVAATTALTAAALIALVPRFLAFGAVYFFIPVLGMSTAGAAGVALLPDYWQDIGAVFPPRHAVELFQRVLYFSSNGIVLPVAALLAWTLVAVLVLVYLEWIRAQPPVDLTGQAAAASQGPNRALLIRLAAAVLLIAGIYQVVFALVLTSANHNPVASNLPFAVTGDSSLTTAVQKNVSLDVTAYPDESAAKTAIGQAKAWGALFPGKSSNTLLTVQSISALAPYTLPVGFGAAAKSQGKKLAVSPYTPTPLPSGDPFGLVLSILLGPLLIGGYLAVTLVNMFAKVTATRWLGFAYVAFAIVLALGVDLIAGPGLHGVPTDKFWILWAIMALITSTVALLAAVLTRLLGSGGTILTVLLILAVGKASSGGANGVAYLPSFWRAIGPALPPRNAYILMQHAVYFDGNGITQALVILFLYLVVFGVILGVLDWYRRPEPTIQAVTPDAQAGTTAVAIPVGVAN
jgi:hypothetical protein